MNVHIKVLHLAIVFSVYFAYTQGKDTLAYAEKAGILIGTTMTTRNGRTISAFLGIPYAKPPVGPLRFKNAKAIGPFYDFFLAETDGNMCPQLNANGVVVGKEDCLNLNVYSPNPSRGQSYPTIVYFHGGDFVRGSASSKVAGPQYLLDRDIVLVTVNYRLGILGFLSTGDAESPGNFGLKDQALALRWVQDNIIGFGGNPKSVTIFGQGAGGASASFHAMSKESNGLFHRYISQSGSALAFWSFKNNVYPLTKYAKDLGKYLNCPTGNSKVLINCLRNIDIYRLVDTNHIFNYHGIFSVWKPTIETRDMHGGFIETKPIYPLLRQDTKDIPMIIGNVADEASIFTTEFRADNNIIYDSFAKNLDAFMLSMINIGFEDLYPERYLKHFKGFYLNGTDPSDTKTVTQQMTKFLTDLAFLFPSDLQIQLMEGKNRTKQRVQQKFSQFKHAVVDTNRFSFTQAARFILPNRLHRKSPTYQYMFDYRGTVTKANNIDVTNGDNLMYLFPMKPDLNDGTSDLQLSEADEKIIDIMIDLWTSFAYTGTPISKSTSETWKAYDGDKQNFLKIGNDSSPTLSTEYELSKDRMSFWYSQLAMQLVGGYISAYTSK